MVDDRIGNTYGDLTVLWDTGERDNSRGKIYFCRCVCGIEKNVSWKLLNTNKPRSCGCSRKRQAEKRFHTLYDVGEDCWNWTGSLNSGGYGKWKCGAASRQAWKYAYGEIPAGMQVCHKCDNRKCVRPSHLFLGTIRDNQLDKVSKNRHARGSSIGNSVMTEKHVLEIRKMRISGSTYKEISQKYGYSWDLVRKVCKNEGWQHVPLGQESAKIPQFRGNYKKGSNSPSSKIKESDVIAIRKMLEDGHKIKNIAKDFSVSASTICDIKSKRTWAHLT